MYSAQDIINIFQQKSVEHNKIYVLWSNENNTAQNITDFNARNKVSKALFNDLVDAYMKTEGVKVDLASFVSYYSGRIHLYLDAEKDKENIASVMEQTKRLMNEV